MRREESSANPEEMAPGEDDTEDEPSAMEHDEVAEDPGSQEAG